MYICLQNLNSYSLLHKRKAGFLDAEMAMRKHIAELLEEEVLDAVDHPVLPEHHQEMIYIASVCHQVIYIKPN
jgi:hypothetical protein